MCELSRGKGDRHSRCIGGIAKKNSGELSWPSLDWHWIRRHSHMDANNVLSFWVITLLYGNKGSWSRGCIVLLPSIEMESKGLDDECTN